MQLLEELFSHPWLQANKQPPKWSFHGPTRQVHLVQLDLPLMKSINIFKGLPRVQFGGKDFKIGLLSIVEASPVPFRKCYYTTNLPVTLFPVPDTSHPLKIAGQGG